MNPALVFLDAVTFSYRGKPVFRDLDLSFERGRIHAVVGPTGCGKTTLLHLLAALLKPTSGSVVFPDPADTERVALIPQDYGLFPWKTVRRNATMGIEIRHGAGPERRAAFERCDSLLGELRIRDLADRWPSTLSGGQKQRVAIARALAVEPTLLLMDEPFSALDADIREGLQDLLRTLPSTYGATPVIVTHDIAEALRIADRLVLFRPAAGDRAVGAVGDRAPFTAEMLPNDPAHQSETEGTLRAALRAARGETGRIA